jgi:hypothetical protein
LYMKSNTNRIASQGVRLNISTFFTSRGLRLVVLKLKISHTPNQWRGTVKDFSRPLVRGVWRQA